MVMADDSRVEVRKCRLAERQDLVTRLLARGMSNAAVLAACMRDPLFDYLDDHQDPDYAFRQDQNGLDTKTKIGKSSGQMIWRAMCTECLAPVYPAAIGSKALESRCRICRADLRPAGSTVLALRRGLSPKCIRHDYISLVKLRERREALEENTEVMDARLRLLEVFRTAMERKELGIAVRAQRELSRMLGLRRRMSEESIGGDLGERLAEQLAQMTTLTRVIGGAGDHNTKE